MKRIHIERLELRVQGMKRGRAAELGRRATREILGHLHRRLVQAKWTSSVALSDVRAGTVQLRRDQSPREASRAISSTVSNAVIGRLSIGKGKVF